MFIHNNIKTLRIRKGLTQAEAADAVGISRSQLAGYEISIKPPIEALLKLSDYYHVTVDTLLKLDFSKLSANKFKEIEQGVDPYIRGTQLRILATTVNSDNMDNIELVHQKACAGYTAGLSDIDFVSQLPTFSIPFLPTDKKFRTFQITGDSMLPFKSGSWIIAEYVDDWNNVVDSKGYIVITKDDGIVFKVLYNHIQDKQSLMLVSLNSQFQPYEVPISDVLEIWKFKMVMAEDWPV